MAEETLEQSIRAWLGIGVSVAIGGIAIWQDRIRKYLNRPRVVLEIATTVPACELTRMTVFKTVKDDDGEERQISARVDCYRFRVKVKNNGREHVEKLEVYVEGIERCRVDQTFESVYDFPPMNLIWTHVAEVVQNIPPGMEKFCDFGSIVSPEEIANYPDSLQAELEAQKRLVKGTKAVFTFALQVQPNHGKHVVSPGKYRVKLKVGAANIQAQQHIIEMSFSGEWHPVPETMFKEGFRFGRLS
jgi:hypothetical protein